MLSSILDPLSSALAPARPTAADLLGTPARRPEQAIAGDNNSADVGGHTPIIANDVRVEIRAIEEHSHNIGVMNGQIIVAKPEQIHSDEG